MSITQEPTTNFYFGLESLSFDGKKKGKHENGSLLEILKSFSSFASYFLKLSHKFGKKTNKIQDKILVFEILVLQARGLSAYRNLRSFLNPRVFQGISPQYLRGKLERKVRETTPFPEKETLNPTRLSHTYKYVSIEFYILLSLCVAWHYSSQVLPQPVNLVNFFGASGSKILGTKILVGKRT